MKVVFSLLFALGLLFSGCAIGVEERRQEERFESDPTELSPACLFMLLSPAIEEEGSPFPLPERGITADDLRVIETIQEYRRSEGHWLSHFEELDGLPTIDSVRLRPMEMTLIGFVQRMDGTSFYMLFSGDETVSYRLFQSDKVKALEALVGDQGLIMNPRMSFWEACLNYLPDAILLALTNGSGR